MPRDDDLSQVRIERRWGTSVDTRLNALRLHNTVPDGVTNQLSERPYLQLSHNLAAMPLGGASGNGKTVGYFPVGLASARSWLKGPRHEIYYFEQSGDLDSIRSTTGR